MARNGDRDEEQPPPPITVSGSSLLRRPDPFLVVCRCFRVLTSLTAILCIGVNVFSAVSSFKAGSDNGNLLSSSGRYWSIGLAGACCRSLMTMAFPNYSEEETVLVLLRNIASYMLLGCGLVYVISGILCIGCLKRARQQKQITRDQAIKDLEEMEQRREELEQLLMAERA